MRRLAPIAVIALLAAAGASAGGSEVTAGTGEPPRVEGLRKCAQRIEVGGKRAIRTAPRDLRVGPVIFFGLRKAADPSEHDDLEPPHRHGDPTWKSPIAVRAGDPVVLAIEGGRANGASLIYDMRQFRADTVAGGGGDAAVRVKPCPPDTHRFFGRGHVGRWTLFSGGFMLEGPVCVRVQVFRAGRVWSAPVSFGTNGEDCPG